MTVTDIVEQAKTLSQQEQKELIKQLVKEIQQKFPEIELINVTPSPENPATLWINVTSPDDDDREMEIGEFGAEKTLEILLDYGYHMIVMPTRGTDDIEFLKLQESTEFSLT